MSGRRRHPRPQKQRVRQTKRERVGPFPATTYIIDVVLPYAPDQPLGWRERLFRRQRWFMSDPSGRSRSTHFAGVGALRLGGYRITREQAELGHAAAGTPGTKINSRCFRRWIREALAPAVLVANDALLDARRGDAVEVLLEVVPFEYAMAWIDPPPEDPRTAEDKLRRVYAAAPSYGSPVLFDYPEQDAQNMLDFVQQMTTLESP